MDPTEHESGYVVNVDVAVVRDGEYLCIERGADEGHASGALSFPGGKVEVEPDTADPIEATAVREVREEVGVEVTNVQYVCSQSFVGDAGTPCLNVVTRADHAGGEPHRAAPAEVAAVHWLTPDEVRAHDAAPDYLVDYLDRVAASLAESV